MCETTFICSPETRWFDWLILYTKIFFSKWSRSSDVWSSAVCCFMYWKFAHFYVSSGCIWFLCLYRVQFTLIIFWWVLWSFLCCHFEQEPPTYNYSKLLIIHLAVYWPTSPQRLTVVAYQRCMYHTYRFT